MAKRREKSGPGSCKSPQSQPTLAPAAPNQQVWHVEGRSEHCSVGHLEIIERNEDTKGSHSEKLWSVLQARGKERQGKEDYYRAERCKEETGKNCAGNLVLLPLLIKSFYFISVSVKKLETCSCGVKICTRRL